MDGALEPGRQLGGYRIEALLDRGGMGEVYRAKHLTMGRQAALKVLAPELAGDQEFRQRFLRESRIAAQLDHPSIVPIYDAGEADGRLYIAMRYVDGSDLRALLRSGGWLDPDRALSLLGQVAGALDAAHAEGVVHRDIKPANILVESGPAGERAYLCDFGLGVSPEAASQLTRTGETLGTAAYMAPEQANGEMVDGRTDGYALGCVLFECLTGTPPYPRDTVVAMIVAHLNAPVPPASGVRPELGAALDTVFERALAKDPADRYPSCQALLTAAQEALAYGVAAAAPGGAPIWEPPDFELDRGPMAGRVPPAAGGTREPRARKLRVGLAVGALALAAAVAGGTLAVRELRTPAQPDLAAAVTTTTTPTTTAVPSTTAAPVTTAAPTTAAPAAAAPAAAAPATTAAPAAEPAGTGPPSTEPPSTEPPATEPPDTTQGPSAAPASAPHDDGFSVDVSGYRGCPDPVRTSRVAFIDYGGGVAGNGKSNDDYVQVTDRCADHHGVKAWAWLNGQLLGSRYNGNGEGSTVIWDPFKAYGNVDAGDLVGLRVCIVDGANDPSPIHCRSGDARSVDG